MRVWPFSIRVCHWIVAVAVVINLFLIDDGDFWHQLLGYISIAVVIIRGFIGEKLGGTSSIRLFPFSPKLFFSFLKNPKLQNYEGHNPVASFVYFTIWVFIGVLAVSGYLLTTDYFWGDEAMDWIHTFSSRALTTFIILHALGILLDSLIHKRKTWMKMIKVD